MKLPLVKQDKANHFIYGFIIYILIYLFYDNYLPLIMVFLIAVGKEIYDEYKYGGFDWKDIVATMIPSIILKLTI